MKIRKMEKGEEKRVSALCVKCIKEINSKDLEIYEVENLLDEFSTEGIQESFKIQDIYVAVDENGKIKGTGSLYGNKVKGVFVDPRSIGSGIGKFIMISLEKFALESGFNEITLTSSKYAVRFYKKLGYIEKKIVKSEVGEMTEMKKKLLRKNYDQI